MWIVGLTFRPARRANVVGINDRKSISFRESGAGFCLWYACNNVQAWLLCLNPLGQGSDFRSWFSFSDGTDNWVNPVCGSRYWRDDWSLSILYRSALYKGMTCTGTVIDVARCRAQVSEVGPWLHSWSLARRQIRVQWECTLFRLGGHVHCFESFLQRDFRD